MNDHHSETELKLLCPDLVLVQRRLQLLRARQVAMRVLERNLRYENAAHALVPGGILLRLRQDSRARLTPKAPGATAPGADAILQRFEAEVEVSDFDTAALILERLGYHVQFYYEKYRSTWALGGAEIVLDELPCGNFVEIEGPVAHIEQTVSALGLEQALRLPLSYAALFERIQEHLGLPLHELTFAAFANITLQPDFYAGLAGDAGSDG